MSFLLSQPIWLDAIYQQDLERRAAEQRRAQVLAWRRQQEQEEYARQYAIAEQMAYEEALRRESLRRQFEIERQRDLERYRHERELFEAFKEAEARKLEERKRASEMSARKAERKKQKELQRRIREQEELEESRRVEEESRKRQELRQENLRKQELGRIAIDARQSQKPQQQYRVVEAPFPYNGYYLVAIEPENAVKKVPAYNDEVMEGAVDESSVSAQPAVEAVNPFVSSEPGFGAAANVSSVDKNEDSEMTDETASRESSSSSSGTSAMSEPVAGESLTDATEMENYHAILNRFKKELDTIVETYDRIFKSESSSDSETDVSVNPSATSSRIKVLQKAQLKLEKIYNALDSMPPVDGDYRALKRGLTSKSVSYADKIEEFIKTVEQQHNRHAEQKAANVNTGKVPAELKNLRKVTIEAVDDDSDF